MGGQDWHFVFDGGGAGDIDGDEAKGSFPQMVFFRLFLGSPWYTVALVLVYMFVETLHLFITEYRVNLPLLST